MTRLRRKWYRAGTMGPRCEDCGQYRPWTVITFWATGMRYRVCGDCIDAYRGIILAPRSTDR